MLLDRGRGEKSKAVPLLLAAIKPRDCTIEQLLMGRWGWPKLHLVLGNQLCKGCWEISHQRFLGKQPASFGGLQIEPDSKGLEANLRNTVVYFLYVAVVLLGFYLLIWHPSSLLKDKIVQ